MNSNAIMSIEKFNYADALAKAVASNPNSNVNNLDIYIPRIDGRYTEDDIKFTFRTIGVGLVAYADFVATKDPETKEVKFYSAFIKLTEWNPNGFWYKQFIKESQTRLQISRTEYWIVLHAKTPLVRSKVNTHQLAAYTDELFQNFEKQSKQIAVQQEMIELQSKNIELLLGKLQEQSVEIKAIKNQLLGETDSLLDSLPDSLLDSLPELVSIDDETLNCEFCDTEYYDTTKLALHQQICSKSASPSLSNVTFCEDECFFFSPLKKMKPPNTPPNAPVKALMKKSTLDMSGTFSFNLSDIAKGIGMSEDVIMKGLNAEQEKEKEKRTTSPENSQRAKTSNIICGNL
jgi:hypothetical protein